MFNSQYKIKILKLFLFSPIIITLISCSSTKEIKRTEISKQIELSAKDTFEIINFKKNINSLRCEGEVQYSDLQQNMSGSFELEIIRGKKLLIDIYGPFGINVARIYATPDSLFLYNLWASKYYQTSGTIDGLEFLSPFVSKFFNLLTAEPFYEKDSTLITVPLNDSLKFEKKNQLESYYFNYRREYASMSYLKYIFKNDLFEVYFRNFEFISNLHLPGKVDIYDLNRKQQIKFKVEEFKEINNITEIKNESKPKFKRVYKFSDLF